MHVTVAGPASDNTRVTVYVPGTLKEAGLEITEPKGTNGEAESQLDVVCIKPGVTALPLESTVDILKDKPSYIPK
mgnify:CR=1 FL=1